MAQYQRPGVFVSDFVLPSIANSDTPVLATPAFVGETYKGPTEATKVTSWNQFVTVHGGFQGTFKYLPYAVYSYFNNGGSVCYVNRVVGSGNAAATATLVDRAATPQNTLKIDAKNVGDWGDSLHVRVVDRSTDRFDLYVLFGGTTDDKIVERWSDVSMDDTDSRYVEALINAGIGGSSWIIATDQDSATASPNNRPLETTSQLASGNDGSAPGSSDFAASVDQLDEITESLVVNLSGQSSSTILNDLIAYCETRGDCFAVLDTASGRTVAQAISDASAFTESSYAAVFYPWINSLDPASSVPGSTRLLPPGGAVLGITTNTDVRRGPYKAAAGLNARIAGAVSLELRLTDANLDDLNTSHVNAVRHHPVGGICVFGARTLKVSGSDLYIPIRRSLIYLKDNLRRLTDFAVFQPNNGTLWALIKDRIERFLNDYWGQGGLIGDTPAQAFFVVCDSSINTAQTIAAGEVHVEVGVALVHPAEFVVIRIGQWAGGASAIEV